MNPATGLHTYPVSFCRTKNVDIVADLILELSRHDGEKAAAYIMDLARVDFTNEAQAHNDVVKLKQDLVEEMHKIAAGRIYVRFEEHFQPGELAFVADTVRAHEDYVNGRIGMVRDPGMLEPKNWNKLECFKEPQVLYTYTDNRFRLYVWDSHYERYERYW